MEENKNSWNKEQLKEEAAGTYRETKEAFRKVDVAQDAKKTKRFLLAFIRKPVETMRSAGTDYRSYFKTAILLLIVWTAAALIRNLAYLVALGSFFGYAVGGAFVSVLRSVLVPVGSVVFLSVIMLLTNRKSSLAATITTVTIAQVPVIAAAVLGLLTIVAAGTTGIIAVLSYLGQILSVLLLYHGMKAMYAEEEKEIFHRKFALALGIYFVVRLFLSALDIAVFAF